METFLIKAAQLLLSLSILVVIHEMGHFLFARLFKIRVEKFYLFFNPWFSLFKYKPKNSDTEYGIGWLPLGGYVKIAGMMDESMDKEQLAQPEQPWEFRSKPAWQRLLVMVGGVLFNFILAIFIFSMMLFVWGDNYLPYKNIKDGMSFSQSVKDGGFQDKDILVSADGKELVARGNVLDNNTLMQFLDAKEITIIRNGKTMIVAPPADFADKVIAARQQPYAKWASTTIDSILVDGTAHKAGLQKGDSIVSIDGEDMLSFNNVQRKINKMSDALEDGKTQALQMAYIRAGVCDTATVMLDSTGVLGFISNARIDAKTDVQHDEYTFFAAFPGGIKMGMNTLKGYVAQSRFVFSKEGAKSLGGFGALGSLFPAQWDWQDFWTMSAFLSIILAFMNILPIPALDGGHIMFLLYEVITRRKPNEKFVEYATTAGIFLLFALLLFANGNDIMRLFK